MRRGGGGSLEPDGVCIGGWKGADETVVQGEVGGVGSAEGVDGDEDSASFGDHGCECERWYRSGVVDWIVISGRCEASPAGKVFGDEGVEGGDV